MTQQFDYYRLRRADPEWTAKPMDERSEKRREKFNEIAQRVPPAPTADEFDLWYDHELTAEIDADSPEAAIERIACGETMEYTNPNEQRRRVLNPTVYTEELSTAAVLKSGHCHECDFEVEYHPAVSYAMKSDIRHHAKETGHDIYYPQRPRTGEVFVIEGDAYAVYRAPQNVSPPDPAYANEHNDWYRMPALDPT